MDEEKNGRRTFRMKTAKGEELVIPDVEIAPTIGSLKEALYNNVPRILVYGFQAEIFSLWSAHDRNARTPLNPGRVAAEALLGSAARVLASSIGGLPVDLAQTFKDLSELSGGSVPSCERSLRFITQFPDSHEFSRLRDEYSKEELVQYSVLLFCRNEVVEQKPTSQNESAPDRNEPLCVNLEGNSTPGAVDEYGWLYIPKNPELVVAVTKQALEKVVADEHLMNMSVLVSGFPAQELSTWGLAKSIPELKNRTSPQYREIFEALSRRHKQQPLHSKRHYDAQEFFILGGYGSKSTGDHWGWPNDHIIPRTWLST